MAKAWEDDEVEKLISDSVAIVREDRIEKLLRSHLSTPTPNPDDKKDGTGDKGNGNPLDNEPPKKRRSLFWGEVD